MVTVNDAYEILNLTPGASQDKVLENYRALALKWHPDKNKQSSESFEKFRKLCSAFRRIVTNDQEFTNDLTMEQMFEIFQDAFLFYKKNGCKSFNSSSEEDGDEIIDVDEEDSDIETKQGNGINCEVDKMIVVRKDKGTLMPVSSEVAKKNAEELLAEEEKERKKAEKRRAKKKRRRQKKKLEKEQGQEKDKETKSVSDSHNKDKTKISSSEESESEEEWDPNSAFVANVANKSKVSNYVQNSKPEKVTCDDSKETSKDMDSMDDNDPTILNSRKLAIRANEIASLGQFDAAIELFSEAIKMNPKDFRFYGNRSYCYEKIQFFDRALRDAEKAISLNSNWPKNYYRKGRALVGLMRFIEAEKAFEKVLSLDKTCKDAEQELLSLRVSKMMEMGFTKQQACLGIQQYGTIEKAVEAMSHFKGVISNAAANERDVFISDDESCNIPNRQKNFSPVTDTKMDPSNPEGLCTLWVGNVSKEVTEKMLRLLFGQFGMVSSLRIITEKFCAFINYENKDSASRAMKALQGTECEGHRLLIKFPDNPPTANLPTVVNKKLINTIGAVSIQSKQTGPVNNNECYFWRTTGCSYGDNCRYTHVKEHKGIDKKGWHKM